MPIAHAMTDSPDQICRVVCDRGAWLWACYTHPSEFLTLSLLFLLNSSFLFWRIFLISWERWEITIKSWFIRTTCLPFVFVLVNIELWLSWLFLDKEKNTSLKSISEPYTERSLSNVDCGCPFSLNEAYASRAFCFFIFSS